MLTSLVLIPFIFAHKFLARAALVEYDLIIRTISSNPDGYPRPVIIVHNANSSWNIQRPIPGPLIRAKLGDTLRIRVTNMMRDQSTTIHFHGLHMLRNPWADGTAQITQCPIGPRGTFVHEFKVEQTGTYWYHSHNSQQTADGLMGPIILTKDSIEQQYEYGSHDYVIMLQEWYHETWPDLMTAYQGPYGAYPGNVPFYPWPPVSYLINGHGNFDCKTFECPENSTWQDDCGLLRPAQCIPRRASFHGPCKVNAHPPDEFICPMGRQIRLRLINAATGIPFNFSIDRHDLTIVARDGIEISPVTVSYLHIPIGQRLDVIVTCDASPSSNYIIAVASRDDFKPAHVITEAVSPTQATALLVYSLSTDNTRPRTRPKVTDYDSNDPFFEYKALKPVEPYLVPPATQRITLVTSVNRNNREGIDALEEWTVNDITFEPPKEPLLLGNFLDGTLDHSIADVRPGRVNNTHATHIYHLEYGQTYEVVMINTDPQQHPWHLHGYSVSFIAAEKLPSTEPASCAATKNNQVAKANLDHLLPALNSTPPALSVGDSFSIPRESYVVFRFTADNPGPWFFHCHMEWHVAPGAALVFSVARQGRYKESIEPSPNNFPTCGQRQRLINNDTSKSASSSIMGGSVLSLLTLIVIFDLFTKARAGTIFTC